MSSRSVRPLRTCTNFSGTVSGFLDDTPGPGPCGTFPTPTPTDANGDGSVDVNDVFYLVNYLFAGGPAPPTLTPTPGP